MTVTRTLSRDDHALLLLLIRGETVKQAAAMMGITQDAAKTRLDRMRTFLEVRTTYQLVALEVVSLMDSDQPLPEVRPLAMAAGA